jgi:hypothetical protein
MVDRSHAVRLERETLEGIYKTVSGEDYPEEAQPNGVCSVTGLMRHFVLLTHRRSEGKST